MMFHKIKTLQSVLLFTVQSHWKSESLGWCERLFPWKRIQFVYCCRVRGGWSSDMTQIKRQECWRGWGSSVGGNNKVKQYKNTIPLKTYTIFFFFTVVRYCRHSPPGRWPLKGHPHHRPAEPSPGRQGRWALWQRLVWHWRFWTLGG